MGSFISLAVLLQSSDEFKQSRAMQTRETRWKTKRMLTPLADVVVQGASRTLLTDFTGSGVTTCAKGAMLHVIWGSSLKLWWA